MKFDGQYVDDTLLVVKPQDLSAIHILLNGFDKNLQFNNGLFENEVPICLNWKYHWMESLFIGTTLILGYM